MKKTKIILAIGMVLCAMFLGCTAVKGASRLDGSYAIETMGTRTVYTFSKTSDDMTVKYFIAGMEVYRQEGKYAINDEETEITLSVPTGNEIEDGTDESPESTQLSGTFTFVRGENYIEIGKTRWEKVNASDGTDN